MQFGSFPDVDSALSELSGDERFERFEAVSRTIFRALGSERLKDFVEADLSRIVRGERGYDALSRPNYVLASTAQSEVNAIALNAGMVNAPKPLVLARDCAFGVVHGGPVRLRVYRSPRALHQDQIDPGNRLEGPEIVVLASGEHLTAQRLSTSYELACVDAPAVCVRIFGPIRTPFNIAFDRETRRPDGLVNALDAVSRIESGLRVIAKTSPGAGLGVAGALLSHRIHTVRWAAAQVACKANPCDARRVLNDLLADRHPRIRAAAVARLRSLDEETGRGAHV